MKNVHIQLTDLNLVDGDVITEDKIAILDKNMAALAEGIASLVSTPVMEKLDVDTSSPAEEKNIKYFNDLLALLVKSGLMKPE